MTDIVDAAARSRMMSGIHHKNTKPELMIRSLLHRKGYRYRIHVNRLPGKPDIVLKQYRAIIFVHGCFWHGHDCRLFKWPKTRKEFWKTKICSNINNDKKNIASLLSRGWRVCTVWECAIRGKKDLEKVADQISDWIHSDSRLTEMQE